jgi:hypothetical protein
MNNKIINCPVCGCETKFTNDMTIECPVCCLTFKIPPSISEHELRMEVIKNRIENMINVMEEPTKCYNSYSIRQQYFIEGLKYALKMFEDNSNKSWDELKQVFYENGNKNDKP